MTETIDERRNFRVDDRVRFAVGKREVEGYVATFRFVSPRPGVEEQLLAITADDGASYPTIAAQICTLVGRRSAATTKGAEISEAPAVDPVAAAIKALTPRGATLISVREIRALATDYLAMRKALANAAAADRSSPYREGERRAGDGKQPPEFSRWLTPRELGLAATEGKLPT